MQGNPKSSESQKREAEGIVQDEFIPLREISSPSGLNHIEYYGGVARYRQWYDFDRWPGFFVIVAFPCLLSLFYFGYWAADLYVSEASFVVKAEQHGGGRFALALSAQASASSPGALLNTGSSQSNQSYMISTYIKSLDGMSDADRKVDLKRMYKREESDFVARYNGFNIGDNNYRLHQYYNHMIKITYDPKEDITKLSVVAFRPSDARDIAQAILSSAEEFANKISERSEKSAIEAAEAQVKRAWEEEEETQNALTTFRVRERMINPAELSGIVVKTIAELTQRKIALKSQLLDIEKAAPLSQKLKVLNSQIASISEQINEEQAKLAGSDTSMSPIFAQYEQLSLKHELANQIYAVSLQQLEAVRLDAKRKHVFIERISGPTLPDDPEEPRRVIWILCIGLLSLCTFALQRHFIHDSRMHHGI